MGLVWGIDLGGTKVECVVAHFNNVTEPVIRKRTATEPAKGFDRVLANVVELVNTVAADIGERPSVLGVSSCGAVNPSTGLMKNCNATCLNGRPFQSELERALGVRAPFANDANCFALAEALLGAGKGAPAVFGVILGSGVGGGVVVHGQVLNGRHGIAGEWGHNIACDEGPECYCGKRGCLEQFIAGPKLEAYYEELSKTRIPLREIEERAARGEPNATQVIDRLVSMLGRALAVVINTLDPDVIVLGGGVSKTKAIYERVHAEVAKYIFNDVVETRIAQHELGDSAGVFGALMLAKEILLHS